MLRLLCYDQPGLGRPGGFLNRLLDPSPTPSMRPSLRHAWALEAESLGLHGEAVPCAHSAWPGARALCGHTRRASPAAAGADSVGAPPAPAGLAPVGWEHVVEGMTSRRSLAGAALGGNQLPGRGSGGPFPMTGGLDGREAQFPPPEPSSQLRAFRWARGHQAVGPRRQPAGSEGHQKGNVSQLRSPGHGQAASAHSSPLGPSPAVTAPHPAPSCVRSQGVRDEIEADLGLVWLLLIGSWGPFQEEPQDRENAQSPGCPAGQEGPVVEGIQGAWSSPHCQRWQTPTLIPQAQAHNPRCRPSPGPAAAGVFGAAGVESGARSHREFDRKGNGL